MQTASLRIRTRFVNFIFYTDSHYATSIFFSIWYYWYYWFGGGQYHPTSYLTGGNSRSCNHKLQWATGSFEWYTENIVLAKSVHIFGLQTNTKKLENSICFSWNGSLAWDWFTYKLMFGILSAGLWILGVKWQGTTNWFGLVWFNGISTTIGDLMPKPVAHRLECSPMALPYTLV